MKDKLSGGVVPQKQQRPNVTTLTSQYVTLHTHTNIFIEYLGIQHGPQELCKTWGRNYCGLEISRPYFFWCM
jgi:hypothetical protein